MQTSGIDIMKSNYRSYRVIERLVLLFSILLLPFLSNAEALIKKDISINANMLSFSKKYGFLLIEENYRCDCSLGVVGKALMNVLSHIPQSREYFFGEGCCILELSSRADDPDVSMVRARVEPSVTTRLHRLVNTAGRYVILQG